MTQPGESSGILQGHQALRERLRQIALRPSLPSTYLFSGPEGTGKKQIALEWGKFLLCADPEHPLNLPCESCRLFAPSSLADHPDLLLLPPKDSEEEEGRILIDQTRKFISDLTNAPLFGTRRVGIINNAHKLTEPAANSLLKTLEDPPDRTVIILITHLPDALLPTVRSRTLSISFPPRPRAEMEKILDSLCPDTPPVEREAMLFLSRGAPGQLKNLINASSTRSLLRQIVNLLGAQGGTVPFDPDSISLLSDEEGFTLFLDTLEALLLDLYRQDAGLPGDPVLEQASRIPVIKERIPHLKRSSFHDRVQELRTLQIHNINRGLAVEELLLDWNEAITASWMDHIPMKRSHETSKTH
ncbi:MAG: hypothetical protein ACYC9S_02525 [Leptospirales bacterium]